MRPSYAALAAVITLACGTTSRPPESSAAPASSSSSDWFVDRAAETGLTFTYFNGMSGQFYFPEMLPGGVALFDYDNDGDLDVYFAQGRMLPAERPVGEATIPPAGNALPLKGRLFRNDLQAGAGPASLRFTDVTAASRVDAAGYGMGAAAGDVDNDGCVDLYLTNLGPNQLFHNNCDGTFSDVSRASGADDPGWSVSASFLDYDRDGWLDLYVGNYVLWDVKTDKPCTGLTGRRDYCTPKVYVAQPDRLYHNRGNGTFEDVTAKALTGGTWGPALGVVAADFDRDGWTDIYVANDGAENLLWMNQRNGTFRNQALLAGAALTGDGKAEASMGVDAGDFDNDGDDDLHMTELPSEGNNLYVNNGSGLFEDLSARSGVGPLSLGHSGFGTAWFDYDNDGWLDLLTVSGAVQTIQPLAQARDPFPLHQRKQLFRNLGTGRFEDVTVLAGAVFQLSEVGRGAAFGDIDNDGDIDVVVANNNGPLRLLINSIGNRRHWIGLRLVGEHGRDMLGARVEIIRSQEPLRLWRHVRTDGSYASANDPRVLIGLGDSAAAPTVRVHWPDGRTDDRSNPAIDRYTTLTESGK